MLLFFPVPPSKGCREMKSWAPDENRDLAGTLSATRGRLLPYLASFAVVYGPGSLHNLGEGALGGAVLEGTACSCRAQGPGGSAGMRTAPAVKKKATKPQSRPGQRFPKPRKSCHWRRLFIVWVPSLIRTSPLKAAGLLSQGSHRGHCPSTGGPGDKGRQEGGPQATAGSLGKAHRRPSPQQEEHGQFSLLVGWRGHRTCLHGAFCSTFKPTPNP